MHHKRKRTKSSRARCMCKMGKHNEFKDSFEHQLRQEQFSIISEKEQMEDFYGRSENDSGD